MSFIVRYFPLHYLQPHVLPLYDLPHCELKSVHLDAICICVAGRIFIPGCCCSLEHELLMGVPEGREWQLLNDECLVFNIFASYMWVFVKKACILLVSGFIM